MKGGQKYFRMLRGRPRAPTRIVALSGPGPGPVRGRLPDEHPVDGERPPLQLHRPRLPGRRRLPVAGHFRRRPVPVRRIRPPHIRRHLRRPSSKQFHPQRLRRPFPPAVDRLGRRAGPPRPRDAGPHSAAASRPGTIRRPALLFPDAGCGGKPLVQDRKDAGPRFLR